MLFSTTSSLSSGPGVAGYIQYPLELTWKFDGTIRTVTMFTEFFESCDELFLVLGRHNYFLWVYLKKGCSVNKLFLIGKMFSKIKY